MVLQELRHGAVGLLALLGQLHREVLGTTQASNEQQKDGPLVKSL